ncbi:MAG: DMT family transporter [Rhizobiales bacterium]|nr:DMT family transporter [Hyphomicrobiales bacterium]
MQPLRGILLKIAAVTTFMVMASLIKATSNNIPAGEAVFFRSFFALPVIFLWLWSTNDLRTGLKTSNPWQHLWRGLIGTCAMGLGFMGLGLLPLPEATAIGFASPVLAVIFAIVLLGEKIKAFRISTVILGLIGVLIILSPRLANLSSNGLNGGETLGAIVVLGSAACAALAQIFTRKLVKIEKTVTIVFYFTISSTTLSLLTIPFGWVLPSFNEVALLIMSGIAGGVGQTLLTSSYRFAPTAVIAPFDYVAMLLALLVGYFIFDEVPTTIMLIGASVVITAGFLIIWRESRLGLSRSKSRKISANN